MKHNIIKLIDSSYFILNKKIPIKTFRYGVCGGSNLAFDTTLYFICFHFILNKQNIDLITFTLSPHIASLFFVFPVTLSTGFLLNKYIVFTDSELSTNTQFLRYCSVAVSTLLISYFLMKLLVDILCFYPTPSRFLTIIITVLFAYIMQHKFSFKVQ